MYYRQHLFFEGLHFTGHTTTNVGGFDVWNIVLALSAVASAAATVALWRIAKKQLVDKLTEIEETSKAAQKTQLEIEKLSKISVLNEQRRLFFNDKMRDIFMLLEYNGLNFEIKKIIIDNKKAKPFPFFAINQTILQELEIDPIKKKEIADREIYSAYEVDDFVLGVLEDIASSEKQGLLAYKDVYNNFSWYLERLWENAEIQKYIKQQKSEEDGGSDIYENIEKLYNKIQKNNKE